MEDTQSAVQCDNQPSQTQPGTLDYQAAPTCTDAECHDHHPSVAEIAAADAVAAQGPKQLTDTQIRQLRRMYWTVRHPSVLECGHKLDQINQPKNNCEFCWWAFFSSHGELVQVTDKAVQEQGTTFLDSMRGTKYRKMFFRYMSTLAKFQKEAAEQAERNKTNEQQGTESQTEGSDVSGGIAGQEVREGRQLPTDGEESRQAGSVDSDGISNS